MSTTSVLLIEDNQADLDLIGRHLRGCTHRRFELFAAKSLTRGLARLQQTRIDVVLLDLSLPDAQDLDAVARITRECPHVPVVVLTGLNDTQTAIASLQHGVQDYLPKDRVDTEVLSRSLQYAIERKRITEDFRQTQEALRKAERLASLGTLAAGIAHEINNPILAAWTSAEAALNVCDQPGSEQTVRECLNNIVSSVLRCRQIIHNVKRFASESEVNRGICDADAVVCSAIEETLPYAKNHSVQITSALPAALGQVLGNTTQLRQVIVALLRNAIEATDEGQEIRVVGELTEQHVVIRVEDQGCGMTDQEILHAFDPFYTSRKESGTGLGLSIAHGIIEYHDGSVEIDSHIGRGTVVTISLPILNEKGVE